MSRINRKYIRAVCSTAFSLLMLLQPSAALYSQGMQESAEPNSSGDAVRLTDTFGNELVLEEYPERIALVGKAVLITGDALYLFPEAQERIIALGKTDQGMGDFYPYLDSNLDEKNRPSQQAGAEEIASLNPDLAVVKHFLYDSLGRQLERIGIPVLPLHLESHASYLEDVRRIGELFGNQERAEEIAAYFNSRIDHVQHAVSSIPEEEKKRVMMLYISSKDGKTAFNAAPDSWIQTYMTETAGGIPVWKGTNLSDGWQTINFEQLAQWDPDSIYVISYRSPASEFVEEISQSALWRELRAFRNGNVKAFPQDFHSWAQPDSRWILGLQWLAHDIYPELFPDYTLEDSVYSFYSELYRIPEDIISSVIIPKTDVSAH